LNKKIALVGEIQCHFQLVAKLDAEHPVKDDGKG